MFVVPNIFIFKCLHPIKLISWIKLIFFNLTLYWSKLRLCSLSFIFLIFVYLMNTYSLFWLSCRWISWIRWSRILTLRLDLRKFKMVLVLLWISCLLGCWSLLLESYVFLPLSFFSFLLLTSDSSIVLS
jgi:hypothetical protein